MTGAATEATDRGLRTQEGRCSSSLTGFPETVALAPRLERALIEGMNVETAILNRRTVKVLGDIDDARPIPVELAERNRRLVLEALETAGWAPFHYPRDPRGIAEPWRAHVLWQTEALALARHLRDRMKVTSKEPRLAAACGALILVTWLPQFSRKESKREAEVAVDEEHLAATAAMVQNLLLLLTARGMGTYWGSGGVLRRGEAFEFLGVPREERLLAAVHVEYPEMKDQRAERKPGKLRELRCDGWIREVQVGRS